MTLKLTPAAMRLIEKKMSDGSFEKPEAVVLAGLAGLDQQPIGDFAPGEMSEMLEAGERSIRRTGTLDDDKALTARRKRRHGNRDFRSLFR